jgi:thiamine pyrophosphate-dependent acetolactate synthase large subunit-like protein
MILMGDGVAFSGAQEELARVAELLGAGVWGVDSAEVNLSTTHPCYQGLTGHMFGASSLGIASAADAVLICGTYVFPDAEIKVFMTASPEERARRRCKNLERAGVRTDPSKVLADIRERDERDSTREMAPLRQAEDAVFVDTDGMSIDDCVQAVLDLHNRRMGKCCTG